MFIVERLTRPLSRLFFVHFGGTIRAFCSEHFFFFFQYQERESKKAKIKHFCEKHTKCTSQDGCSLKHYSVTVKNRKNWELSKRPSLGVRNAVQPLKGQGKPCGPIGCYPHAMFLSERNKL